VKFLLENAAGRNGWVIQHVTYERWITDCDEKPILGHYGTGEYWEAWQVINGDLYAGRAPRSGGAGVLHSGDVFGFLDFGTKRKGKAKKTGYVRFYEGYSLTEPPWGNSIPETGGLPSIRTAPFAWDDSGMLTHYLAIEFDCCCSPIEKTTATGFPWW
jgi:hypothetical protein